MIMLGIETSCDETSVGIVENDVRILSNVVASQVKEHGLYGGVVPEIASRRHTESISGVARQALDDAGLDLSDIDAIAVTNAPGLVGALLVGVNFAKGLAYAARKPLVAVHHLRGHIASLYLSCQELAPPFIAYVVSGGHSHLIEVQDYRKYVVLGRTADDAAGEAFDKVARILGLPYPGGVEIERAAVNGDARAIRFPNPKVNGPWDFSFSGIKTAAVNLAHNYEQRGEPLPVADIAACFQETVCRILADKFFAAATVTGDTRLVAAGGVCANTRLRELLTGRAKQENKELLMPPLRLCGDNAAMIGAQAFYESQCGHVCGLDLNAHANMPVDESFAGFD